LKAYTKNPTVTVKFINFYITVLGEVNKPGRIQMASERTTILEALGMAGDLSDMAKREDILVIRELEGKRSFERLNLLDKNIFNSAFYYLKNNDVVYVVPTKTKFLNRSGFPQYLSAAAITISAVVAVVTLTRR
ncbi:MAG: polysaccharide biosynthesis/export family protein, partial [Ferruginibacter sp.]